MDFLGPLRGGKLVTEPLRIKRRFIAHTNLNVVPHINLKSVKYTNNLVSSKKTNVKDKLRLVEIRSAYISK